MADIPVSDEANISESGKDYDREFGDAAQMGKMILEIARERVDNRYSMPYLNPQRFSPQDIEAVRAKPIDSPLIEDDLARAKKGAVSLAIEATAQITEAQVPRNARVKEELGSLEKVLTLVKRGHGFVIQVEAQNSQVVIQSSREAIARRQGVQPDQIKLTDEELKRWANDNFQKAGQRINRSLNALREYLL